jgi:hypothetical protein
LDGRLCGFEAKAATVSVWQSPHFGSSAAFSAAPAAAAPGVGETAGDGSEGTGVGVGVLAD